jgi:hypothetical protein
VKTQPLIEASNLQEAQLVESERVIHNVRLIRAGMSLNRRDYSLDVLTKAAPLFEGVRAYANHPDWFDNGRSVRDITGWFTNIRAGADGIYATRHFSRNHAGLDAYEMAVDILTGKAPPTLYGLSINAVGKTSTGKDTEGKFESVDEIVSVYSVDDVTTPAAGGALLVAGVEDTFVQRFLKNITLEDLEELRPDMINAFKKKWQAVRQDDALKATREEIEGYKLRISKADEVIHSLEAKVKGLEIDALLASSKLPVAFIEDLRKRLTSTEPSEWPDIMTAEARKVEAVSSKLLPPREIELPARAAATVSGVPAYELVETPEQHAAYLRKIKGA